MNLSLWVSYSATTRREAVAPTSRRRCRSTSRTSSAACCSASRSARRSCARWPRYRTALRGPLARGAGSSERAVARGHGRRAAAPRATPRDARPCATCSTPRTPTAAGAARRASRRRSSTPAGPRSASPPPAATRATSARASSPTSAPTPGQLNDLGELSRTILVLRAAGVSRRRSAGATSSASCSPQQRANGSFAGRVNTTAFAILAPARRRPPRPRRRDPARRGAGSPARPNTDGGFNFAGRGGPSGIDDTGAALQALARRRPRARHGRQARRALHRPPPERRRRLRADPGRPVERAVDRLGRPGPARRGARPGEASAATARATRWPTCAR